MSQSQSQKRISQTNDPHAGQTTADVIQLKPPRRWHDPLQLIQNDAPSQVSRIVLWTIASLIIILMIGAAVGKLDIIATADGKLTPQTLVKIVQPAEPGVVTQLLVNEGDLVKSGQILARLDPTLAHADRNGIAGDLAIQQMQLRRLQAELNDQPMLPQAGDDPTLYVHVQNQYVVHRKGYLEALDQEKALLDKAVHEKRSATDVLSKLEQTLPSYRKSAEAFTKLEQEGFIGSLAAAEKQREMTEKSKDLDAQRSTVAALDAAIVAQQKRISQLQSSYKSDLQKELNDVRTRVSQLQPALDKNIYKEGLMELRAPQDGVIKDLATTTIGAVVQPGTVMMSLVPHGERLFADVNIKNEDVGFVQVGQTAQIKIATYPFQKYGMLTGTVIHVGADATDFNASSTQTKKDTTSEDRQTNGILVYKARIALNSQALATPHNKTFGLTSGMQVIAEINQGRRTVLEYLLSPVQKAVNEAGRER
jgi:hemolysin D